MRIKLWACLVYILIYTGPLQAGDSLDQEIQVVLDRMHDIYAADPNGSREIFDELWLQDENIVYFSEQFEKIFYGYEAAKAYWQPKWDTLYGYREVYSNLETMLLNDDLAIATCEVRYDMHAVTRTPLGGWTRLAMILRRTDDGWKIQQYYEAPMSLISQGRRIHEEALDPEFAEFARAQNPAYDRLVDSDENIRLRKEGVPWEPRPPFRPPGFGGPSRNGDQKDTEGQ
jgi:ketosteroid isomerase-like protein